MNKEELIYNLSKRIDLPKSQIEQTLSALKDFMIEVLNKGGKLSISNFGKFEVKESKERIYRNIITKRQFVSRKKKYVKVKLFKKFKFSIK